jgi:hypothetical protein
MLRADYLSEILMMILRLDASFASNADAPD